MNAVQVHSKNHSAEAAKIPTHVLADFLQPECCVHLQKCIAHRVAKLYGLETLTVSNSENSENTSSVGVRRTRKSVHIPQVMLALLYLLHTASPAFLLSSRTFERTTKPQSTRALCDQSQRPVSKWVWSGEE